MERLAVTGSTGFIGQWFLREYCNEEDDFEIKEKRDFSSSLNFISTDPEICFNYLNIESLMI